MAEGLSFLPLKVDRHVGIGPARSVRNGQSNAGLAQRRSESGRPWLHTALVRRKPPVAKRLDGVGNPPNLAA